MKPGSVTVGLATTDTPQCWEFVNSLEAMMTYNVSTDGPINNDARRVQVIGGPSLAGKRNKVVRTFLEHTDSEWLLFIDDDQQFMPDLAHRMVESADPDERPIVSALIMARRNVPTLPVAPACTIYHDGAFRVPPFIPADKHWHVATAGTGCILIHRKVLEAMAEEHADDAFPWFKHAQHPQQNADGGPDEMSEDYTFSLRAAALDFPVVVDTTIEVGHVKRQVLTPADFYAQPGVAPPAPRTIAIIPVKDKLHYTKGVVGQLLADPDCDEVIVVDNGSKKPARRWLDSQPVTVIDAPDAGIHAMWNMAAHHAVTSRTGIVNLLFLNNDVELGDEFCGRLAAGLRDGPPELAAVCPNYDGRDGGGVERLRGVCGERYDGTGGLAGFAFMLKGEVFAGGYRFPEDMMWWWGDTDLTLTIDVSGGWYGMVHGVTVKHLDGGGNTGKWSDPAMQEQLLADQAAFRRKWEAAR